MSQSGHTHNHDHHGHEHHHGHSHSHAPAHYNRAFAIGIALNLGFVLVETMAGLYANSLSLLADAGHNFGDVFALVLSWGALWLSQRKPSKNRTYGFGRTSILASLINGLVLMLAVVLIAWEALGRFIHPVAVESGFVIGVALVGIVINTATALMFMRGGRDDINIRGAFLHMAADAGVSLGVVIAGIVIAVYGWLWIDPAISLVIAAIIAFSTWGLLKESVDLTIDAVPRHIDSNAVQTYLSTLPGVTAVHDLHIWPLSTTSCALTAHLVRPGVETSDDWLYKVSEDLQHKFKIDHTTIQIQNGTGAQDCRLAPPDVV